MKVQVGCGVLMRQVSRRSQVWSSDGGDEGAGGLWVLMRQGVQAQPGVEV